MADCGELTADALINCDFLAKAGIENSNAVAVNRKDIDWSAVTKVGAKITAFQLLSGKAGFAIEWLGKAGVTTSEFVPGAEDRPGQKQGFACRLPDTSLESIERGKELDSGSFVVFVETKYKGALVEDAFKVYGIEVGLEKSEGGSASNENSAVETYTLSTPEGEVESYSANIYLNIDYATSKASYDTKFIQV